MFIYCFSINLTCALRTSPEARRPSRICISKTIETRTMHDGSFRVVLLRERALIREKLVARSPGREKRRVVVHEKSISAFLKRKYT